MLQPTFARFLPAFPLIRYTDLQRFTEVGRLALVAVLRVLDRMTRNFRTANNDTKAHARARVADEARVVGHQKKVARDEIRWV